MRCALRERLAPLPRVRDVLLVACLLAPGAGFSHDLWVVPGKYRLAVGEPTRVFINNGDAFPESLTLVGEHRLTDVKLRGASSEMAVSGFRVDGQSLTFEVQAAETGSYVIAVGTRPRTVRLKGEDFESFLDEEHLETVSREREAQGEAGQAVVERYAKWAKAIVDVGDSMERDTAPWTTPVGHTIEIVPLDHPNRVVPGGSLRFRVLYEGSPLAGAPIEGTRAGGAAEAGILTAVTDEDGQASVTLPSVGRWYVRAIHFVRVQDDPQLQWESFWSTLSFEVRSPAGGNEPVR
jgi:hypothetical protein